MKKIHITLVGGQPAPIYHGIVATHPDKVVYVYSSSSKNSLSALKKELDIDSEELLLDPTDPQEILAAAVTLAKKYADDEITVNISSGLKSWSHFFGVVFDRMENAAVVYMDQNNVLWNYKTLTSSRNFNFDMHALFRLYGNSLDRNYRRYDNYTQEDKDCISKIEQIRLHNVKDFNLLTAVLTKEQSHILQHSSWGKFTLENSPSYVEWEKSSNNAIGFVRIGLYNRKGWYKEMFMESENIVDVVFNSAWFELKVATILERWNKTQEICMNCRFPFKTGADKNETDIIINTGTKILFVECKTQIAHPTDIDKFRSVVKAYGGMGSKGLFITDARMTDVAREKCKENGILSFSLQDDHKHLSSEDALIRMLDSELFNINTK